MALYLTWLADELRAAGINVIEYDGWKTRARGSGGYSSLPLCVMWHHTASPASWDGQKDASYCATGDSDAPLANLYIQRNGTVWVLAAGATNTNGKGNQIAFSRGIVPADGMNTRAIGVEMGNDGVGERWPQAQVDSMFVVSNVCNAKCGNRPEDMSTHNFYAPTRKIDPATDNVAGPWVPGVVNSSRSWNRADVQGECMRRAASAPDPKPPEPLPPEPTLEDVDMYLLGVKIAGAPGDGILGLRISAEHVVHEPNGTAYGIDKWFGLRYQECGDSDAATLFVSRTATGPCPVADPNSQWYSKALADAWRT